jgi:hypothetical protein
MLQLSGPSFPLPFLFHEEVTNKLSGAFLNVLPPEGQSLLYDGYYLVTLTYSFQQLKHLLAATINTMLKVVAIAFGLCSHRLIFID